jgi:hypothetical protein
MRRAGTLNLTDRGTNDVNATISDATRVAIKAGRRAGTVMAAKIPASDINESCKSREAFRLQNEARGCDVFLIACGV